MQSSRLFTCVLKDYSLFADTLLSNLTATFDEKLRLLLDPHYQSTGGGDPVSSNPTTDPPQPLVRNTPLKMDSNRQVAIPLKQQRSRSLQQHQNQAELAKVIIVVLQSSQDICLEEYSWKQVLYCNT